MQVRSRAVDWRIRGASDALDASMAFKGSMQSLKNLIPDPSTMGIWTCRPASIRLASFNMLAGTGVRYIPTAEGVPGISVIIYGAPRLAPVAGGSFGFISTMKISGNVVYGMVAQIGGPLAGYDAPFAFNLSTNTVIIVTGTQTTATLPQSQPATGAWTPPQMDLVGVKMMVAHPGFTGAGGNFVGWFDITTPTAPVWHAGNLTGGFVSFTTAPISVRQFFNRAWYIHNAPGFPAVIFSDALNATNCTNATQVLTFNDSTPLTALGGLPLNNELGGIIQSLMVFKGTSNIFQVTGDAGLNNLFVNALNVATGTVAQNSVANTPQGLVFLAPDGIRLIDFTGQVQDPIGYNGQGITVPFVYAAVPSRVAAACNGNLLRISTQNANIPTEPQQDWWYDIGRGIWSGPHSFPASLALPYQQTFIIAPVGVLASLWQSDFVQYSTSSFIENGAQMQWAAQTSLLPDTDQITNNTITEASVDLALPPTNTSVAVSFNDHNNSPINGVSIAPASSGGAVAWGTSVWNSFAWGGGLVAAITPYFVPWTNVITFARGSLSLNSNSVLGFKLSTAHLRWQIQKSLVNVNLAAIPAPVPVPPAPPVPPVPPVVSYTGPGDVLGASLFTAYWGFRAFSAAARGSRAVQLRRSSDSAVMDAVTLSNGQLDAASITAFKGAGTLTVAKMYDQTGNGHDLVPTNSTFEQAFTQNVLNGMGVYDNHNGNATAYRTPTTLTILNTWSNCFYSIYKSVANTSFAFEDLCASAFNEIGLIANRDTAFNSVTVKNEGGNPNGGIKQTAAEMTWHVVVGVIDQNSGSQDSYIYVDNQVPVFGITLGACFGNPNNAIPTMCMWGEDGSGPNTNVLMGYSAEGAWFATPTPNQPWTVAQGAVLIANAKAFWGI